MAWSLTRARTGGMGVWMTDLAWSAAIIATATLYYVIGPVVPSLALLLVLGYLVWRRSDLAAPLIPLAVPLFMLPKHLHQHLDFSLGETVIVLCAVIVLAQQLLAPPATTIREQLLPGSPFNLPALAFLAAALLATLAAHFHGVALRQFREVIVEPLLFYWLILQRVRGAAGAARLTLAVVAAGVVVAAMGAIQIAFRPHDLVLAANIVPPERFVRAVYGNENNLALLLDRAAPMAVALALLPAWLAPLLAVGRSHNDAAAPHGDRVGAEAPAAHGYAVTARAERLAQGALLLSTLLMLVIVYRTGSRGGEVTLVVCLGALYIYWQRRRPAALAAGALVVAALGYLGRHKLESAASGGHGLSNLAHTSVWESALRMIRDHPLLGVGPDNFLYYYSNDNSCAPGHIAHYYYVQAGVNFERCINHPHNLFLDFWLSTGFLGLLAGVWLLALFAWLGIRAFQLAPDVWRGPLLAALVAVLALVTHGQVDNAYFLPDLSVIFWLCVGIVALWEREADEIRFIKDYSRTRRSVAGG